MASEYGNNMGKVQVDTASEFTQAQQNAGGARMESYNPSKNSYDQAYVPQNQFGQGNRNYMQQHAQPGQMPQQNNFQQPMNMNGGYPQQNMNGYQQQAMPNNNNQAMNAQAAAAQQNAMNGPNGLSAYKNLEVMDGAIPSINAIAGTTTEDGRELNTHAVDVVIDSLHTAINVLDDAETWVPQAKQNMVPTLNKVGGPLKKALKSYLNAVQSMK
jgi:hypothetical protein